MLKVHILASSSHCNGEAYLFLGAAEDCQGNKYNCHISCPFSEGSSYVHKWINIYDFAKVIQQAV
jgi:hypothetical protein